jgi:dihydroorotase
MEKAPFGIVGVETMLPIALEFYHAGRINLSDLLSKMTWRAADIINFDGGTLEIGKRADLTVVDLDHEWTVETEKFVSRSKNSPFNGRKVKGMAVMTIVCGEVKFGG